MSRTIGVVLIATFTLTMFPASAASIEEVLGFQPRFKLPADAGMVSIKEFGAVGDGETDDTRAFLEAFGKNQPRSIYIPNGTYIVRDQLRFGVNDSKKKRVCVMGESRSGTIIKLADNSPGFSDPSNSKAFIHARHPQQQGEQNMANYFYHLTIEIGRGNSGAVALNYHTNNTGAIKDVAICATDPVGSPGHIGLGLLDWEVGPGSGRYITVDGFDTGVALRKAGNYFTMEHVTVRRCQVGVEAHSSTSIRGLKTEQCQRPL